MKAASVEMSRAAYTMMSKAGTATGDYLFFGYEQADRKQQKGLLTFSEKTQDKIGEFVADHLIVSPKTQKAIQGFMEENFIPHKDTITAARSLGKATIKHAKKGVDHIGKLPSILQHAGPTAASRFDEAVASPLISAYQQGHLRPYHIRKEAIKGATSFGRYLKKAGVAAADVLFFGNVNGDDVPGDGILTFSSKTQEKIGADVGNVLDWGNSLRKAVNHQASTFSHYFEKRKSERN